MRARFRLEHGLLLGGAVAGAGLIAGLDHRIWTTAASVSSPRSAWQ